MKLRGHDLFLEL